MLDRLGIDILGLPLLLGRSDGVRNFGSGYRGNSAPIDKSDVLIGLALLAAVVCGLWLLARFRTQQERRKPYTSPRKLFTQLCRTHGLDWRSRLLLMRLVRTHRLPQPALVFVDERYFHLLGQQAADWQSKRVELERLRRKLFASPKPDAPSAS